MGAEPHFEKPWALWVRHKEGISGLAWHAFEQLPSGWWVWRNAASRALQEPAFGDDSGLGAIAEAKSLCVALCCDRSGMS